MVCILSDSRGQIRVALNWYLDNREPSADRVQQIQPGLGAQEMTGLDDDRRNRDKLAFELVGKPACASMARIGAAAYRDQETRVGNQPLQERYLLRLRCLSNRFVLPAMSPGRGSLPMNFRKKGSSLSGTGFPSSSCSSARLTASLLVTFWATQYSASFCSTPDGRRTDIGMPELYYKSRHLCDIV